MLLKPQALAQHFLHGVAHRIFIAANDRLDLHARSAQAFLQRIGGVKYLRHRMLATRATLPSTPCKTRGEDGDQQQQHDDGQAGAPGRQVMQSAVPPCAGQIRAVGGFGIGFRGGRWFDRGGLEAYHSAAYVR